MANMTHLQVLAKLRKAQKGKSLRAFAMSLRVSAAYLSDVYLGRRGLGPTLLQFLELRKVVKTEVYYVRDKTKTKRVSLST